MPINVKPSAGRMLHVLLRATGARRVLEVGTLFGYSAIWMARALPEDGHIDCIEMNDFHADAAQEWFEKAGVAQKITIHRGASRDVLPTLQGPYDAAFLDAEKQEYVSDAAYAVRMLRPGGMLLADNVLWKGEIASSSLTDPQAEGIRRFHDFISNNEQLVSTTIDVGDGLSFSVKK